MSFLSTNASATSYNNVHATIHYVIRSSCNNTISCLNAEQFRDRQDYFSVTLKSQIKDIVITRLLDPPHTKPLASELSFLGCDSHTASVFLAPCISALCPPGVIPPANTSPTCVRSAPRGMATQRPVRSSRIPLATVNTAACHA